MSDLVERITGVAVMTNSGVLWSLPAPHRHHHIFSLAAFTGRDAEPGTQGFTTNLGRFVNRFEAARLAVAADQILRKHGQIDQLYSEDVW